MEAHRRLVASGSTDIYRYIESDTMSSCHYKEHRHVRTCLCVSACVCAAHWVVSEIYT